MEVGLITPRAHKDWSDKRGLFADEKSPAFSSISFLIRLHSQIERMVELKVLQAFSFIEWHAFEDNY